ncbi:putative exported peptidase [Minicystis rosea]|nr:putative exported peptidase [Minicystis rosea]
MSRWRSTLALSLLLAPAACSSGAESTDPPPLVAEAGYLEVPAQQGAAAVPARMFYSFQPADERPEDAPLLVFFNGGPGAATTGVLFPFGTGPHTLDASDLDKGPAPNPDSYTRFANLLYLDERDAGFSYELGVACEGSANYVSDAGDFIHALLDFLDGHPALIAAPVVLVGESYGGTRAPAMLHALQHYVEAEAESALIPWLTDRVQTHFDRAFPERAGLPLGADLVAAQFGWEVLIQPNFLGLYQIEKQRDLIAQDPLFADFTAHPENHDADDIRRSVEEGQAISARAAEMVRDPDALTTLLGVPLASIHGLAAADRVGATRVLMGEDVDEIVAGEHLLRERLGELPSGDAYWLRMVTPHCGYFLGDASSANALLEGLSRTHAFMTNARYDAVVYSPAIPFLLRSGGIQATVDESAPAGAARPGVLELTLSTGERHSIRFPPYESGHEVTTSAAAELRADVELWLRETGALVTTAARRR